MKNEFKYISEIGTQTFENENVLPFINEEGKPCVLIRNSKNKNITTKGSTDNLEFHFNSIFSKDGKNYYFHVISCVNNDGYSKEQFEIAYEYLFKTIDKPQSDYEISKLINSIEQLFKITPEKNLMKLHTGIYGELLFLFYAHMNGITRILSKYHSDFFSKHDLELDNKNRIEIKTTLDTKRIHHFSHDQIFRKDVNVLVISILLEESSEGVSLNELFDKVIKLSSDPQTILMLGQLKGFCGISSTNVGPSFSFEKACDDLRVFIAEELPHLEIISTNGISNVAYDVDCSMANNMTFSDFVTFVNKIIM